MTIRCIAAQAADALPTLAAGVAAAQGSHPLTPVTIIVPTNAVGVTARRWLGGTGGVAAIEMVTAARLAERLAGAVIAGTGRRPISTPVIDLAVRDVLRDDPGIFGRVAEHPSTVTSLRDLHREVRLGGPGSLRALRSASTRGAEAARVSGLVAERLAVDWFDEADLLDAAISRVHAGDLDDVRHAIAFLPPLERGLATDLLRAVGARVHLEVIVDTIGVDDVDADAGAFADLLEAPLERVRPAATGDSAGSDAVIVSTTDADEEVRDSVRRVVEAARAGVPFARMAIVWPTDRPYARLVEHHLDAAGIAWNGRPGTLVTERLVPRFLLDLLDLDRRGLRRGDVFDFLADVPVHTSAGERVSVARWERLARIAGITRDEHWQPRLARLAASYRSYDPPRTEDADDADELAGFVSELQHQLGHRRRTRTWGEWAQWCEEQVALRLGPSVLDQLDEAERLASDHASRVLDRLRHLDSMSRPVDRRDFRAAFAAEFEGAPGRLGRLGNGITIGSLAGTAGLGAELTIVLGAADGLLPPPPPADPLISDADRRAAGLPTSDTRARRIHRSFAAHLATSGRVVVHTPRGDLRATTERIRSRWLPIHLPDARHETINSHHAGIVASTFPPADHEYRLRERAIAAASSVETLAESCVGDAAASRALRMRAARASTTLSEFDGDLTGVEIDHFPRPVSASQIERWPSCPHAYFMRHLLGVVPIDDPADELGLSPLERGNVIHDTLDRFHRLVLAGEIAQPGTDGWSADAVTALMQVFEETADLYERTGRTGRAANWFLQRRSVRNEVLNWIAEDGQVAAARHAEVIHSELGFGRDGEVVLPLPDGRRLAVLGFADRIDRTRSGELVIVDHKTGKADPFKKIDRTDPTEDGHKFQLPVYAAAALAEIGEVPGSAATPVRAEYSFFDRGGYARYGYSFDDEVWDRVAADLGRVVSGIESGLFPAVTDPPAYRHFIECWYCQPDGLGVEERFDEWDRKRLDPRLAAWRSWWFDVEDDA